LTDKWWNSIKLTRARVFIAATALFLGLFAAFQFWPAPPDAPPKPLQFGEGWQETPYLWAGKTLEELKPRMAQNVVPKYAELRFAYPSAEACLVPSDTGSPDILGRDLIWYQLETKEAVEVCLFRVFTWLGDLAKIEAWLESQGFGSKYESDRTRSGFYYGVEGEQITKLTMIWRTSKQGALFGITEAQRKKRARHWLNQTASVTITENGRVLTARLSGQSTRLK